MMGKLLCFINLFLVGFPHSLIGVSSASDHDVTLTLFHNYELGSNKFVQCARYTFYFGNVELKNQCMTPEVRAYMQENANNKNAIYRMHVELKMQDKVHSFQTFMGFFQFRFILKITVDDNFNPISVTAKPQNNTLKNLLQEESYITVVFNQMEQGPQPDTATFIHKMEREREAKEKGASQDNRSFLAKYWIYILPLLIFAVLSGSVNADGNGAAR